MKKVVLSIILIFAVSSLYSQETKNDTPLPEKGKKVKETIQKPSGNNGKSNRTANPVTAADYFRRGIIKNELSDLEGALEDYNKAIELDPEMANAFLSRGDIKFILQDFEAALLDFTTTIELSEKLIGTYTERSGIKFILEDFQGAAQDKNLVNTLKPALAKAYYKRGNIKHFLGDDESSCTDLLTAGELGYMRAYSYIRKYCEKESTPAPAPAGEVNEE